MNFVGSHILSVNQFEKADIERAFAWWEENRSPDQAALWYERIFQAISTLERMPERCPLVPEPALSIAGSLAVANTMLRASAT